MSDRFGEESRKKRAAAQALIQSRKDAAEKAAFESGAEKTGGFLGFGGSYAPATTEKITKEVASKGLSAAKKAAGTIGKGVSAASGIKDVVAADSVGGGTVSGVTTGLSVGGPIGAVVGGVVGAAAGLMNARAKRKREAGRIESEKQTALGDIAQEQGQKESDLLLRLGQAMKIS